MPLHAQHSYTNILFPKMSLTLNVTVNLSQNYIFVLLMIKTEGKAEAFTLKWQHDICAFEKKCNNNFRFNRIARLCGFSYIFVVLRVFHMIREIIFSLYFQYSPRSVHQAITCSVLDQSTMALLNKFYPIIFYHFREKLKEPHSTFPFFIGNVLSVQVIIYVTFFAKNTHFSLRSINIDSTIPLLSSSTHL